MCTNSPVLPCRDTEALSVPLLVVTVTVYSLPGTSTLNVHSLVFGCSSLVSMVTPATTNRHQSQSENQSTPTKVVNLTIMVFHRKNYNTCIYMYKDLLSLTLLAPVLTVADGQEVAVT